MVSEKIFDLFLPFMQAATYQVGQKSCETLSGLLNKHGCEKKFQISSMRQQKLSNSTFPILSLLEL